MCYIVCKHCGAGLKHKRPKRVPRKRGSLPYSHAINEEYIDPNSFGGQSSYSR